MNDSSTPESPEEQLPHEVTAALKQRYGPPKDAELSVPESVDRAILADAAAHLRTISPTTPAPGTVSVPWYRQRWVAASGGTLAAAALLFMVWPGSGEMDQMTTASRSMPEASLMESADVEFEMSAAVSDVMVASNDIDQNGEVNILDAFALARSVERQDAGASQWDQNGDGHADDEDIQLIAMAAVTL